MLKGLLRGNSDNKLKERPLILHIDLSLINYGAAIRGYVIELIKNVSNNFILRLLFVTFWQRMYLDRVLMGHVWNKANYSMSPIQGDQKIKIFHIRCNFHISLTHRHYTNLIN